MKKLILILFVLISMEAFSQISVKEGSFKHIPGGVILNKNEYTDINNYPMALIKISTENINEYERGRLRFTGNMATQVIKEYDTGKVLVYLTAKNATFLKIAHPDYGECKYKLENLCDYCVYEMVVKYTPLVSDIEANYMNIGKEISILTDKPNDEIYIDEEYVGKSPMTLIIPFGTHTIKAERNGIIIAKIINVLRDGGNERVEFNFPNSKTFIVNGVSFSMIEVKGGTFVMGSNSEKDNDDKQTCVVKLSDYYIGETEVTQELWKAVMGENPSNFEHDQNPVESISWYDCQEFIQNLNKITGESFRLPTEAEWEFAARGGGKSEGCKYSGGNTIEKVAWYYDNSSFKPHKIKTKLSNELGIFDMSGNVWEWCEDWRATLNSGIQIDPKGSNSGTQRILRGGSWYCFPEECEVLRRAGSTPDSRYFSYGMRLVL